MNQTYQTKSPFLLSLFLYLLTSCSHFTRDEPTRFAKFVGPNSTAADGSPLDTSPNEESSELLDDEDEAYNRDSPSAELKEETPDDLGEVTASQTLRKEEIEADLQASKSFPLVYNEFVEQWVRYFTGRGKGFFSRWLARSTRYIPIARSILKEQGMPEDLIYLAMIESGFNPIARSRAAAVGPWQFIKGTGQRYDLTVDYWIDERKDIRKSTLAAAKYLKELHQIFGSWYLAAAAYNAGEGKVLFAIRRDKSRNFWELARQKKNFRAETRNYVPKIIAAALVAKNPEKFGFTNIAYEEPISWENMQVPSGVDLRSVADLTSSELEILRILNSELRRDITPPGSAGYELKVPIGKKELLTANLNKLKAKKISNIIAHEVKRGENLGAIARRYGANVQSIMELNQIRSAKRLRIGMELSIPLGDREYKPRRTIKKSERTNSSMKAEQRAGALSARKKKRLSL